MKKRSWVCYCNWNVMCHVPKSCSMIEAHCTMQHIWFVYTVHQTIPFCCRGGSGSQDYSGTSVLKTTIPVLSSEVSWFQGEINFCWDSVKCADYLSILISGVSFMRGSTECLFKLRRPQHLQESITTSCLAIRTGQCQVPPHETTCLPGVTWDHYTLSGNISICFPPLLCKQRSDQILEAVGTRLFSE